MEAEPDVFDGLEEDEALGTAYSTEEIEAALASAEALLGVGALEHGVPAPADSSGPSGFSLQEQHHHHAQPQSQLRPWAMGHAADSAATSEGGEAAAAAALPPRPASAFSLGEAAMQLRLSLHEKQMELLHLRAQHAQLSELGQAVQQQLEEAVAERDTRVARLEDALARREAALDGLTQQLQAFRGLTPEAAAALRAEAAALREAKAAAEAAAADLQRRQGEAARRVAEGVATWERLQAELQGQVRELSAALAREQSEAADLRQEREVLRARLAMLEAQRAAGAALAGGLPAASAAAAAAVPTPAAAASTGDAVAAAQREAAELRQQLGDALERLEARQHSTSKYKEAVRALKRRVAELEAQLAAQQAAADAGAREAREAAAGEASKATQAAEALHQAQQELAAAREQCREHARRRGELDAQLATAEYERSQWEWRAKDAERRAQAAEEAADAAGTAAARLAGRRQVAAEGRAADKEAEAKAASLRALQLEKALAQARRELDALRQQQAPAPARPQQAQQPAADRSAREQAAALQQQVAALRQQLSAAQERQTQAEYQLRGKTAALAASEKRLRQFEGAMQRLAAKQGGGAWRIGVGAAE